VWGQVDARVTSRTQITAATSGAAEIAFDRDTTLLDEKQPTTVIVDAQTLSFPASDPIVMHKVAATWSAGPSKHDGTWKRGEITGPIATPSRAAHVRVGRLRSEQARANEESHAHGLRSAAACRCGIRS